MENPASFDLNLTIRRWREDLGRSPVFRRENLHELEAHLRDSIATLAAGGFDNRYFWWPLCAAVVFLTVACFCFCSHRKHGHDHAA